MKGLKLHIVRKCCKSVFFFITLSVHRSQFTLNRTKGETRSPCSPMSNTLWRSEYCCAVCAVHTLAPWWHPPSNKLCITPLLCWLTPSLQLRWAPGIFQVPDEHRQAPSALLRLRLLSAEFGAVGQTPEAHGEQQYQRHSLRCHLHRPAGGGEAQEGHPDRGLRWHLHLLCHEWLFLRVHSAELGVSQSLLWGQQPDIHPQRGSWLHWHECAALEFYKHPKPHQRQVLWNLAECRSKGQTRFHLHNLLQWMARGDSDWDGSSQIGPDDVSGLPAQ